MVKATAKNCANTLLSTRVAIHFAALTVVRPPFLHCAIALEVTSNSSMVEHLSRKQKEPVRIRRWPAYQAAIKKTLVSTRAVQFYS